mgnify:CR=1 FL=1
MFDLPAILGGVGAIGNLASGASTEAIAVKKRRMKMNCAKIL